MPFHTQPVSDFYGIKQKAENTQLLTRQCEHCKQMFTNNPNYGMGYSVMIFRWSDESKPFVYGFTHIEDFCAECKQWFITVGERFSRDDRQCIGVNFDLFIRRRPTDQDYITHITNNPFAEIETDSEDEDEDEDEE